MNLNQLCIEINKVMGDYALDSKNLPAIMKLLAEYESNIKDWQQYNNEEPNTYTRNLVDDGNGKFNLMILSWSKGSQSPIHDHSNSHCLVKMLQGSLNETLYDWPAEGQEKLNVTRDTVFHENQVSYMHDKLGLHRISNKGSETAISLHLYSPPFQYCKTFCEQTGKARKSGKCTFYSVNGKKLNVCEELMQKYQNNSVVPDLSEQKMVRSESNQSIRDILPSF